LYCTYLLTAVAAAWPVVS